MHYIHVFHNLGYETRSISYDLLHLFRDVTWKLCSGSKKLAYKFGQAGFIELMLKDLKMLTPQMDSEEVRLYFIFSF